MMYQSSGYDDWNHGGETKNKGELLRTCLFWALVYLGIPIVVFVVGGYFATNR